MAEVASFNLTKAGISSRVQSADFRLHKQASASRFRCVKSLTIRCGAEPVGDKEKTDSEHEVIPSGEWPANFSMSNYEDLSEHYSSAVFGSEGPSEGAPTATGPTIDAVQSGISGEWPANFSMSVYEDLSQHYAPNIFKEDAQPSTLIAKVMSRLVSFAKPESLLSEVVDSFTDFTGLPVIDDAKKVVGVISKIDSSKGPADARVKDLMTSPAVTITADSTVLEAAVSMLKNKIHRLPVVNESSELIGIVTRTDIFSALDELA